MKKPAEATLAPAAPGSYADIAHRDDELMQELAYAFANPEWLRRKPWESSKAFYERTWRVSDALRSLATHMHSEGIQGPVNIIVPPMQVLRPAPRNVVWTFLTRPSRRQK